MVGLESTHVTYWLQILFRWLQAFFDHLLFFVHVCYSPFVSQGFVPFTVEICGVKLKRKTGRLFRGQRRKDRGPVIGNHCGLVPENSVSLTQFSDTISMTEPSRTVVSALIRTCFVVRRGVSSTRSLIG